MTVRDGVDQPRRIVPRDQWRFARRQDNGQIVDDPARVYLEGGFEPGKIYDVVYKAQDPPLAGLGLAAIRDVISQLKYEASPELSISRDDVDHAIAWGVSQSGRLLRTFLYDGFNRDEGDRKTFDGVMAHVAGGGRGSFNIRFAQPSRDGHPFMNKLYPVDTFPFTGIVQSDPVTDLRDGLLAESQAGAHAEAVLHELVLRVLGADGVDDPHDDRWVGGCRVTRQRADLFVCRRSAWAGRFPPRRTTGQQLSNPNDYSWFLPLAIC